MPETVPRVRIPPSPIEPDTKRAFRVEAENGPAEVRGAVWYSRGRRYPDGALNGMIGSPRLPTPVERDVSTGHLAGFIPSLL